jgi:8-oxo-dGTP pyrophosphatase MutT (NUDIX family)
MEKLRLVERPGVTAAVVNKGKVLILKRINLPFIVNPGVWSLVAGGLKKGERPIDAAYREVEEETGLGREHLKSLGSCDIFVTDRRRGSRWKNHFFVIQSSKSMIRLNIENRAWKWVGLAQLKRSPELLGPFEDSKRMVAVISKSIR